MGRRKKSRTEASSSAPMVEDTADVFPLAMEEEELHHDPQVGASSSRAGASSKKKKKSAFSAIPDEYSEIPDTLLLKELGKHLSAFCRSQMTSPISGWRCTWQLAIKAFQKASPDLRAEIEVAGFGSFLTIPHIQCDRRLIKGLCERWFGETNTFHLPCCEFGISPMDFVMLTGIHMEGEVLPICRDIGPSRAGELMGTTLETMQDEDVMEGSKVKLSWLATFLLDTDTSAIHYGSPLFEGAFRRLLLYILGTCFFMTDHSSVEAGFLEMMDPIGQIRSFDWGGSIYASILAGLRRVSRGEGRSVHFFYPLLEMWSYEYLDPFRPRLRVSSEDSFPRSARWSAPSDKVDGHLFEKTREELDRLSIDRVTLHPYARLRPSIRALGGGVVRFISRRVAFSFQGNVEFYLGERVQHQLDGEFRIPLSPPVDMTPSWGRDAMMEHWYTRGFPIGSFMGEVVDYPVYRSWLRRHSIGPIMRPFSVRPGATEVGGRMVEEYYQMEPLVAVLEGNVQCLTGEIARLRLHCATFEDPAVTLRAVPPFQCRALPEKNPYFDVDPAQDPDEGEDDF